MFSLKNNEKDGRNRKEKRGGGTQNKEKDWVSRKES